MALGDALKDLRSQLAKLTQGITGNLELALDGGLAKGISHVGLERTGADKDRDFLEREQRQLNVEVRPSSHTRGPSRARCCA